MSRTDCRKAYRPAEPDPEPDPEPELDCDLDLEEEKRVLLGVSIGDDAEEDEAEADEGCRLDPEETESSMRMFCMVPDRFRERVSREGGWYRLSWESRLRRQQRHALWRLQLGDREDLDGGWCNGEVITLATAGHLCGCGNEATTTSIGTLQVRIRLCTRA